MTEKRKLELAVPGMSCETCPDHVERALRGVAGVEDVQIPAWKSEIAEVTVASQVKDEDLLIAVNDAGYPAIVKTSRTINFEVIKDEGSGSNGAGRNDFDLIVIGGGSAGFAAAIKGNDLGAKVAMIEANTIGGTCVNVGCLPSKTLIQVAKAWHSAAHHPFKGAETKQGDLDWSTIRSEKDALVAEMRQSKYIEVLAAYPEITFIEGYAVFQKDGSISVGEDVEVISRGRAAAEDKLGHPNHGRGVNRLVAHLAPNRVKALEPIKQLNVLRAREGAGQSLIEVVVGVDQTGQHDHVAGIDHIVRLLGKLIGGADGLDHVVANE